MEKFGQCQLEGQKWTWRHWAGENKRAKKRTLNNKLDGSEAQMPDPSYALALPEGDSFKAAAEFT